MLLLLVCEDQDDFVLFSDAIDVVNLHARCIHAANGEEALSLLRVMDPLPNIIFLERNMTGLTALQCAAQIRANPATENTPIYLCGTTMVEGDDKEYHKQLKLTELVLKPSNFAGMVEVLRRVLLA